MVECYDLLLCIPSKKLSLNRSNNELSRNISIKNWYMDGVDDENWSVTVFSRNVRSKIKQIQNHHIVSIWRFEDIRNRENTENCIENFYLNELLQTTWGLNTQKKTTGLTIATYEKVLNFNFLFDSCFMMIEIKVEQEIRFLVSKLLKTSCRQKQG